MASTAEGSKLSPALISLMIQRGGEVFGEDAMMLFGEPSEANISMKDSGAEESDSFHSNLSGRGE